MGTWHKIVFGDSRKMDDIPDKSVHLMVTSPPYFNAPFDYPDLFKDFEEFMGMIKELAKELKRVMADGRICCFVTQDVRVDGRLYPVSGDIIKAMMNEGFYYRDRIIWRKPEGYIRISRRSGVIIQHPYPMYFYPDNLFEEILILQNGEYAYPKIDDKIEKSKISLKEFNDGKYFLTVWDVTNVLPKSGRLEDGIAAYPDELPKRLIKLFSYVGDTILDPFLGSGTTMRVAKELGRNSIGYELDIEIKDTILEKIGYSPSPLTDDKITIIEKPSAKKLRTELQNRVKNKRSVTKGSASKPKADLKNALS